MDNNRYCTIAVTGSTPTFQAIFICHDCCLMNKNKKTSSDKEKKELAAAIDDDNDDDGDNNNSGNNDQRNKQGKNHSSSEEELPLCICQSCMEICHDDHNCEYVGMGPCYCDCNQVQDENENNENNNDNERCGGGGSCCQIIDPSIKKAHEMGCCAALLQPPKTLSSSLSQADTSSSYIQPQVFNIPILSEHSELNDLLIEEACCLIKHSKETFWIDEESMHNSKQQCLLEKMAWMIYQRHVNNLNINTQGAATTSDGGGKGGAEWWVQIKSIRQQKQEDDIFNDVNRSSSQSSKSTVGTANTNTAIDLHYDKDEALAETFGIGRFPILSTVTYLIPKATASSMHSNNNNLMKMMNPTIIFDHEYTQQEDHLIETMWTSWPDTNKHLIFDGRYLHGAPSHEMLKRNRRRTSSSCKQPLNNAKRKETNSTQQPVDNKKTSNSTSSSIEDNVRVTFLVNIWSGSKPAALQVLNDKIRNHLCHIEETMTSSVAEDNHAGFLTETNLEMIQKPIPSFNIKTESDYTDVESRNRIEIPFVCKGITWDNTEEEYNNNNSDNDDDDEDEDINAGLIIRTYPPPLQEKAGFDDDNDDGVRNDKSNSTTIVVKFGSEMQAYLDYRVEQDDEIEEEEEDN